MMVCHRDLTIQISRFLRCLLQSIYDRVRHSTTFNTGPDAIDAVEAYAKKGLLRSSTLFATVHINNIHSIFLHEESITALENYLHKYVLNGKIQGITISTIIQLVRLFLDNQYFLYENKLYQQVKGSSFKSPMTTILANLHIHYCQENLMKRLHDKNEIFGR
jgi:hypothetical protein